MKQALKSGLPDNELPEEFKPRFDRKRSYSASNSIAGPKGWTFPPPLEIICRNEDLIKL